MNRTIYILAALVVGGFAVLSLIELISIQTPYLRFVSDVRSVTDRPVWFLGSIIHQRTTYNDLEDELVFILRDPKGDTIRVRYKGLKPTGFDRARQALVRGNCYGDELIAHQIVLDKTAPY
ncbi:MAG: cytochrome c maturation protein CcmE [Armatimonadota bacterium]|nr:cytochrome c maturation protein CcmE [Armatimonadota bacterium]